MSTRGKVAGLSAVAVVAVAAAAGFFVTRDVGETPEAAASSASASASASAIDADSTGSAEGAAAAATTTAITTATTTETPNPRSGQTIATDKPAVVTGTEVPVFVTFSGWNAVTQEAQVGGYAAGIAENGGTCTLTLTQGGLNVDVESAATADAATTACGAVTVPGARLSGGMWRAVLSYKSADHAGTAEAVDIEVTR